MNVGKLSKALMFLGVIFVVVAILWHTASYSEVNNSKYAKHFNSTECLFKECVTVSNRLDYNPAPLYIGIALLLVGGIVSYSNKK